MQQKNLDVKLFLSFFIFNFVTSCPVTNLVTCLQIDFVTVCSVHLKRLFIFVLNVFSDCNYITYREKSPFSAIKLPQIY